MVASTNTQNCLLFLHNRIKSNVASSLTVGLTATIVAHDQSEYIWRFIHGCAMKWSYLQLYDSGSCFLLKSTMMMELAGISDSYMTPRHFHI